MGAGTSYSALILKNQYKEYVGVDLDIRAINLAKSNISRYTSAVSFYTPKELNKSFPDHSYDVAISFEVIEHLENPIQMLECLKQSNKKRKNCAINTQRCICRR